MSDNFRPYVSESILDPRSAVNALTVYVDALTALLAVNEAVDRDVVDALLCEVTEPARPAVVAGAAGGAPGGSAVAADARAEDVGGAGILLLLALLDAVLLLGLLGVGEGALLLLGLLNTLVLVAGEVDRGRGRGDEGGGVELLHGGEDEGLLLLLTVDGDRLLVLLVVVDVDRAAGVANTAAWEDA